MYENYRAHRGWLLGREVANELTHEGKIIPLYLETKPKYLVAEVLSIGAPRRNKNGTLFPIEVEVGDRVWTERLAVEVFSQRWGNTGILLIRQIDVWLVQSPPF